MGKLTSEEIDRRVEEIAFRCKYEGYMQSKRWKEKRRQKFAQVGYKCQRCGYDADKSPVEIPVDVHHLTYEHLGDEPLSDLIVLCRHCHQKEHGRTF